MKFFIDTANLADIKEAADLGVLDGVTTNPSLMAKEGISGQERVLKHYVDICQLVDGPISAEVIATDYDTILQEGEALAKLHPNIIVKVPMTKDGCESHQILFAKRNSYQLHAGFLGRAGVTGGQSRCYVCVAFCGSVRRYIDRRYGPDCADTAYLR